LRYGTPRQQARLLESDCAALIHRRDGHPVEVNRAGVRGVKAAHLTQQSRLSTPRRADERDDLACADLEIDVPEYQARRLVAFLGGEGAADPAQ
jgi:hypothetical protein